jgi:hypothetical protein
MGTNFWKETHNSYVKFGIFMAVRILIVVFGVLTSYSEDIGSKFLWNSSIHPQDYRMSNPEDHKHNKPMWLNIWHTPQSGNKILIECQGINCYNY